MPSPIPGVANPVGAPGPAGQLPTPPASVGEPAPTAAPSPTPLLDAEIRRAQAINRQHIESLKSSDSPTPVVTPVVTPPDRPASPAPPAATSVPNPVEPDLDVLAPLPLAATIRVAVEPETAESPGGNAVPPLIPIDPPIAGPVSPETAPPARSRAADNPERPPIQVVATADAGSVNDSDGLPMPIRPVSDPDEVPIPTRTVSDSKDEPDALTQPDEEVPPASGGSPARTNNRKQRPPLEIAALRLCSKVKDIGWVDPVNPESLKPGQRVRVYCEITGLEYQAHGDAFVSRLAAHLELRSGTDGPVVWEQAMGTAEDLCHRRRRDYYVSYEVKVPASLEPGSYRLRLIQTDLVSNQAASSEISVTIVR
jgi:hypothetical protein